MAKVTVEVCTCCALSETFITEAIDKLKAEHGEKLAIIPRDCLDVCAEFGAVKVEGEILTLKESDIPHFCGKVAKAAASK